MPPTNAAAKTHTPVALRRKTADRYTVEQIQFLMRTPDQIGISLIL